MTKLPRSLPLARVRVDPLTVRFPANARAEVIQRAPLGYLKTLATRYRAGDMSLRYAIESLL